MSTLVHEGARARTASDVRAADWGLLFMRLALGAVFFAHGGQKMFGWFGGHGLEATVAGFAKGGIPAPLGYLVAFTELFGGLGLIVGVLARLSALGIGIVMLVAILKVHLANGFFMNWEKAPGRGEGFEFHILAIGIALALLLAGPGRLALADWERRWMHKPTDD
jgi:putative oxidoreductase